MQEVVATLACAAGFQNPCGAKAGPFPLSCW
jgi:hypothetical protein